MSAPPKLAAVPDTPATPPEASVLYPLPGLMGVPDIAPNPSYGMLAGNKRDGYRGGAICPTTTCLTAVKFVGRHVAESDCPTGEHVALTAAAAGHKCEGEWRRGWVRWTCPRCRTLRQLAVEIDTSGPEPVAVFVRPESGA